jgi:ubiquinone biosynthesis UbiH/UbiF/VisC/COQ6 family hydroxylase
MNEKSSDVLIVGSGIVGMATLMTLEKYAIKTSLLTHSKNIKNNLPDPRFYAVTPGVKNWLEENGVCNFLAKDLMSPVNKILVYSNKENSSLSFDAYDAGMSELAFIINHDDLEKAFMNRISKISYDEIKIDGAESLNIEMDHVDLVNEKGQKYQFKLIIGADGSDSWVRRESGIEVKSKTFNQTALVFNIKSSKTHQGCAFQKFMQDGILALLPIQTHEYSVVYSLNDNIVDEYKKLDDLAFLMRLKKDLGEKFGDIDLLSKRQYFPLSMKINESLISDRVVLIGDAAHQVHPLAGQGLNLGLRDVIEFDALLNSHQNYHHDLGLKQFVKKYNRNRKTDILSLSYLTDQLSHIFYSQSRIMNFVINLGFNKINQNHLIKKILIEKAAQ